MSLTCSRLSKHFVKIYFSLSSIFFHRSSFNSVANSFNLFSSFAAFFHTFDCTAIRSTKKGGINCYSANAMLDYGIFLCNQCHNLFRLNEELTFFSSLFLFTFRNQKFLRKKTGFTFDCFLFKIFLLKFKLRN